MSYNFMSNIPDFSVVATGDKAFDDVYKDTEIIFQDKNNIRHDASFLMIRAGYDSDLLIQLKPSEYCIYIPAGEMWSVDSIGEIEKFIVKEIFDPSDNEKVPIESGKIQWMIGYK